MNKKPRRWIGLTALALVLAAATGAYQYRYHLGRSEMMRADLERNITRAEENSRVKTKAALQAVEAERGQLATVAISGDVLASVLKVWNGVAFKEPRSGVTLTLESITPQFTSGFPKVTAVLQAQWQGRPVKLEAEGVLKHELVTGGVQLRFVVLGIAAPALPAGLRNISSAELASRLNALIPPFSAPLPNAFEFSPKDQTIGDEWVKAPNGRVKLHFDVPTLPPLKIDWQPVTAFFDEAGLRVLARLSTTGPLPQAIEAIPAANAPVPSTDEMHGILKAWPGLPTGASYFARVPAQPILDLLDSLNRLPEAGRTIKVQSSAAEGRLMDKSGGPPLGSGFGAWLEHPDSLKVDAVLSVVRPSWRTAAEGRTGGVAATGHLAADGRMQVHVHVNAPKILGRKIGGGVGSSIGATASAATDVTVLLAYRDKEQEFALQIESPAETYARVNIGGVPDDLERWLKAGFEVPLPVGKDLYRFKLPPVISQEIRARMPDGFTPTVRAIKLSLDVTKVEFLKDALEVSGRVNFPAISAGAPIVPP